MCCSFWFAPCEGEEGVLITFLAVVSTVEKVLG